MAQADETIGMIKGLAEVVKTQQNTQTAVFKETTEHLKTLAETVESLSKALPHHEQGPVSPQATQGL